MDKIPVDDTIIYALAKLIDDAQKDRRDPSHYDIDALIKRHGLSQFDLNKEGSPVGKAKRVKGVLLSGVEPMQLQAERFAAGLIDLVRGVGGFREGSPNFVGAEAITNLSASLKVKGIVLASDGVISNVSLASLSGRALTAALRNYVERAQRGVEDAALVVGTSKDLLEAVSAHVLQELWGSYSTSENFPTLLGQAFVALEMATPETLKSEGEHPRKDLERGLYQVACSINRLRNKQGTGHGRPWIPDVTKGEAQASVETMGIVAGLMLDRLEARKA
ncbi:MAG: abortive infection family protein [Gallionellaceae bacterium]